MTQEDYFKLCKKHLDAHCSKEEELLESYGAKSSFKNDVSEADAILNHEIYSNISERINLHPKQHTQKTASTKFLWLRIAASLLIVGALTLIIYNTTAWKNGLFIFKDKYIQNVVKTPGYWYGGEAEITDEAKHKSLYGTISAKRSLEDFMQLLKLTEEINYTIKEGRVIVMK